MARDVAIAKRAFRGQTVAGFAPCAVRSGRRRGARRRVPTHPAAQRDEPVRRDDDDAAARAPHDPRASPGGEGMERGARPLGDVAGHWTGDLDARFRLAAGLGRQTQERRRDPLLRRLGGELGHKGLERAEAGEEGAAGLAGEAIAFRGERGPQPRRPGERGRVRGGDRRRRIGVPPQRRGDAEELAGRDMEHDELPAVRGGPDDAEDAVEQEEKPLRRRFLVEGRAALDVAAGGCLVEDPANPDAHQPQEGRQGGAQALAPLRRRAAHPRTRSGPTAATGRGGEASAARP